jgi:hypothetical protein
MLIACAVLAVASTASAQQLVYRSTFRNGGDSRWSHPSASQTPSGRSFLGPFTKEPVVFSLTDLPPHTRVTVAFNLFAIGGWAGSDAKGGPDVWEFGETGAARQLYSTFATTGKTQSYPAPYPQGSFSRGSWTFESNTLGYSADSVFHVQRTFIHSASELLLEFRSSGERWGLDNVQVWVTPTGLAAHAWGYGGLYGQVGNDLVERQPAPRGVGGVEDVIAVAGGDFHSLALSADGSIWGWGDNGVGQTVTGSGPIPRRITGPGGEALPPFSAIASGPYTALALGPGGTLWTWGGNWSGQAGLGFTSPFMAPTQIPKMDSFVAVAAGYEHSVALRADGSVWTWGRNDYGQLGLGFTGPPVLSPTLVGAFRNLGANIVAIAAGEEHVLAIDSRGSVWGWGYNGFRQLGGTNLFVASPRQMASGALSVAAGQSHTLVLLEDGRVSAWGDNQAGQLGTGLTSQYGYVQNATGGDLTGVVAIGASGLQSFAITNGDVWGFGSNDYGQLGTGASALEDPFPARVRESAGMIALAGGLWHSLGVGPAPVVSTAPSEVDFGQQVVGSNTSRTVTLANIGARDVFIFGVDLWGGEFSTAFTDCSSVLAPGDSCRTDVTFKPSAVGPYNGMLQVRTNTPALFVNVPLSGAGASPDTTGPEIMIVSPREGAVYKMNDPVVASYSCTDVSGVAGCVGSVAIGAAADTSTVGTKYFLVTATDTAGNVSTRSVIYTVALPIPVSNHAPLANDQAVSTGEGTSKPITLTASDANGDPLTYSIATGPEHGTLSGTPPNVTYIPSAAYVGADSFTFKANDGNADSNVATVSITVESAGVVTFKGTGMNSATGKSLSAQAAFSFDPTTMYLTVKLTNSSADDVMAASDVLTAVFFNVQNGAVLTPVSALIPVGTVVFGPDGAGNVGGEWAYKAGYSFALGATRGISTNAFSVFGFSNLRGPELDAPLGVDNHNYGLTSAGDDSLSGDSSVTGDEPLIKNSATFQLKSSAPIDPKIDIDDVSFQYGTSMTAHPNLAGIR